MFRIFKKSEAQLISYLSNLLRSQFGYKEIITTPDYVYAIGNIPVMMVAHLDTVHYALPTEIFHDQKKNVIWSPQGIGADDRAGVMGVLKLISPKQMPYILFTTKEEIGGIGALKFLEDFKGKPKPPVNLVIELDRRGSNDAVFYDCYNVDFIEYIEKFGFVEKDGSFSDISILCPDWGIAGVNLSTGYYNEHTKEEYLNLNELNEIVRKVKNIFNALPEEPYEYIEGFIGKFVGSAYDNYLFECSECRKNYTYFDESKIFGICKECYDDVLMISEVVTTNKKTKKSLVKTRYKKG